MKKYPPLIFLSFLIISVVIVVNYKIDRTPSAVGINQNQEIAQINLTGREDTEKMYSYEGMLDYVKLPQLIAESGVIVIGTVGNTLMYDYPGLYQQDKIPAWFSEQDRSEFLYGTRDIYQEILVSDILKGEPHDHFILVRPDVHYYTHIEISDLVEGERILLFASVEPKPEEFTDKLDHIYISRDDNGIFEVDSSNRAFPRTPEMFTELTTEEGYYIGGDKLHPFFDIDKLRLTIESYD